MIDNFAKLGLILSCVPNRSWRRFLFSSPPTTMQLKRGLSLLFVYDYVPSYRRYISWDLHTDKIGLSTTVAAFERTHHDLIEGAAQLRQEPLWLPDFNTTNTILAKALDAQRLRNKGLL